jgi:twitching motility protein PilU
MHQQLYMDLSLNLKGIVAQMLLPTPDGKGRVPIVEVLTGTPLMQDQIRKGEVHLMKELMKKSGEAGMQTFDQALFKAYADQKITYEDALKYADSPNDLRLMIKLASENPEIEDTLTSKFSIQEDEAKSSTFGGMNLSRPKK